MSESKIDSTQPARDVGATPRTTQTQTTQSQTNATVISYITSTATPTFIFNTNVISTEITFRTTLSPISNPSATAALASASAILAAEAANSAKDARTNTLNSTKFIILTSIGAATLLLLLVLSIGLLVCLRRRKRKVISDETGTESPPLTSLAVQPFSPNRPSFNFPATQSAPGHLSTQTTFAFAAGPTTPAMPRQFSAHATTTNQRMGLPPPRRLPTRPRRSLSEPLLVPSLHNEFQHSQNPLQRNKSLARKPLPLSSRISEERQPTIPILSSEPVDQPPSPSSLYSTTAIGREGMSVGRQTQVSPVPPTSPLVIEKASGVRDKGKQKETMPISPTAGPSTGRAPRFREGFKQIDEGGTKKLVFVSQLQEQRQQQQQQQRAEMQQIQNSSAENAGSSNVGVLSPDEIVGENDLNSRREEQRTERSRAYTDSSPAPSEMMFMNREMARDNQRTETRASSGVFPDY